MIGKNYLNIMIFMKSKCIWNTNFSDILNIQYEDIVENLEIHIKEMLKFCDLEFESCVSYMKIIERL